MYNSIEILKGLDEKDAQQVYKLAVEKLKKEDPYIFLKTVMSTGAGGAAGVAVGVLLKDIVLQIQGINLLSLGIFVITASIGGALGGIYGSIRLRKRLDPHLHVAKEELGF